MRARLLVRHCCSFCTIADRAPAVFWFDAIPINDHLAIASDGNDRTGHGHIIRVRRTQRILHGVHLIVECVLLSVQLGQLLFFICARHFILDGVQTLPNAPEHISLFLCRFTR